MHPDHHSAQGAHGQQHPFHLVNPSPWPIVMAFSMLVMVTGLLFFMHDGPFGKYIMFAGMAMVISTAFVWWRDVIDEGLNQHAHTRVVQIGLRFGMALFIVSEVMFFFAFFWAFFNASISPRLALEAGAWPIMDKGPWPPQGITSFDPWDVPLLNTLILLLSGTTVTWAHYALLHNNRRDFLRALTYTVLLGATFTCLQAYEYHHAHFGFKDGIYASTFYMATGFHGAHVIIGTIFLLVNLIRGYRGTLSIKGHLGFEFAAWYWHFVDVVWLFLFVWVYWWGGAH